MTSEILGGRRPRKGSGRQTSSAASPTRAVSKPIDHALAEAGRQPRRDPVSDDLLDDAVAHRHAARHSQVRDDMAGERDEADEPRTAAIELGETADQAEHGHQHEQHVDDGTR